MQKLEIAEMGSRCDLPPPTPKHSRAPTEQAHLLASHHHSLADPGLGRRGITGTSDIRETEAKSRVARQILSGLMATEAPRPPLFSLLLKEGEGKTDC